jgi:hypothetical protein
MPCPCYILGDMVLCIAINNTGQHRAKSSGSHRRDGARPVSTTALHREGARRNKDAFALPPVQRLHFPLLGVVSRLRRVKSKAPALRFRAESPAIISTGQRPVKTGTSQQLALKGRNPVIDSMSIKINVGARHALPLRLSTVLI